MQHDVNRRLRFVAFMLAGLSLAGLAFVGCTPKFTTPTLVAAKGGDVSKLNPIAVVNFSGKVIKPKFWLAYKQISIDSLASVLPVVAQPNAINISLRPRPAWA